MAGAKTQKPRNSGKVAALTLHTRYYIEFALDPG
jgi:hypothetical protein